MVLGSFNALLNTFRDDFNAFGKVDFQAAEKFVKNIFQMLAYQNFCLSLPPEKNVERFDRLQPLEKMLKC